MNKSIDDTWISVLSDEFDQKYFKELEEFVDHQYSSHICYPPINEIFNAFKSCKFNHLKVVILGQDPYHGLGQANGLSFSVNDGIKFPPSLRNIFKELESDTGEPIPISGNLSRWAEQGVLLLNATLTVQEKKPGSHQKKGWETFTDNVIKKISHEKDNIVFILWGNFAKSKIELIDSNKHIILSSGHPSPFSAHKHFFGCKHFSKCNEYLSSIGTSTIEW